MSTNQSASAGSSLALPNAASSSATAMTAAQLPITSSQSLSATVQAQPQAAMQFNSTQNASTQTAATQTATSQPLSAQAQALYYQLGNAMQASLGVAVLQNPANIAVATLQISASPFAEAVPFMPDILFLEEFHKFEKLPTELRLRIWKLALPGPRFIELELTTTIEEQEDGSEITHSSCVARCEPPAMIHACSESRFVASKKYKLCFGEDLKYPTYFDPNVDALVVTDGMLRPLFSASYETKIGPSVMDFIVVTASPDPEGGNPLGSHTFFSQFRRSRTAAKYASFREIVVLQPADQQNVMSIFFGSLFAEKVKRRLENTILLDHQKSTNESQRCPWKKIPAWEIPPVVILTADELGAKMAERGARFRQDK